MADVQSAGLEWTVLTWNIHGTKSTDVQRVAEVIEVAAPDVVALQEVRRPQADELAERLAMTAFWTEKHHPWRPLFPSWAEGAAVLTPHRLRESDSVRVSDVGRKRSYRRRIAQWTVVERADGAAYRVFNLHLSPHDLHEQRRREATYVSEIARTVGDAPPQIVAGDFNDQDDPGIIGLLPGIEAIAPPPTNPANAPDRSIDHVLVPSESRSVSASVPAGGVDWARLSDHLPLTLRFTLDWVRNGFGN